MTQPYLRWCRLVAMERGVYLPLVLVGGTVLGPVSLAVLLGLTRAEPSRSATASSGASSEIDMSAVEQALRDWHRVTDSDELSTLDQLRPIRAALETATQQSVVSEDPTLLYAQEVLRSSHFADVWEDALTDAFERCYAHVSEARDSEEWEGAEALISGLPRELSESSQLALRIQNAKAEVRAWRDYQQLVKRFLELGAQAPGAIDTGYTLLEAAGPGKQTPAYERLQAWFPTQQAQGEQLLLQLLREPKTKRERILRATTCLGLIEGGLGGFYARVNGVDPQTPLSPERLGPAACFFIDRGCLVTTDLSASVGDQLLVEVEGRKAAAWVTAHTAQGLILSEKSIFDAAPPRYSMGQVRLVLHSTTQQPTALPVVQERRDVRLSLGLPPNGPSRNRLDLYFLADGFHGGEEAQEAFYLHTQEAYQRSLDNTLFLEYDEYFNYWALGAASSVDGVSSGPRDGMRIGRVAYFPTRSGSNRRYEIADRKLTLRLVEEAYPQGQDGIVVIGNLSQENRASAGLNGGIAACPATRLGSVVHELGHALAGLNDEYDSGDDPPARAACVVSPNLISARSRGEAQEVTPWQQWLDSENWTGEAVGMFPSRADRWHPQASCTMRGWGTLSFCVVCSEEMLLKIYTHVRPVDAASPPPGKLVLRPGEHPFQVRTLRPYSQPLEVRWKLSGSGKTRSLPNTTSEEGHLHSAQLPAGLLPGRYQLRCEVEDTTPWVRRGRELLQETLTWELQLEN